MWGVLDCQCVQTIVYFKTHITWLGKAVLQLLQENSGVSAASHTIRTITEAYTHRVDEDAEELARGAHQGVGQGAVGSDGQEDE